jgi:3-phosphoinositide dependent protein kinase-1
MGGYATLKDHVFFEDIEWETMPDQTPPKLMPYLPSTAKGEQGFRSDVNVSIQS